MAMNRFSIFCLLSLFCLSTLAVAESANVAKVDFIAGLVTAKAASGALRTLAKGNEVTSGDTVMTGDGRAQLVFSDGALVSLQPKTEFKIDEYRFNGRSDGEEKGFFSLIRGGLRTISGLIGKKNRGAYALRTEVATIGIRGTEYTAELDSGLKVSTQAGEVEVCNQGGCASVKPGETVFTPNANTKPEHTQTKANLPSPGSAPNPTLYAGGEQRTALGGIELPTLPSGPGYATVYASTDVTFPLAPISSVASMDGAVAVFDVAGRLSSTDDTANPLGSSTVVSAATHAEGATDGIVAWGRWATANSVQSGVPGAVSNFHYVTGVPAPVTALSGLIGLKTTMALMGYTAPTSESGVVGTSPVTGSFTVQFGGPSLVIGSSAGQTVINTNLNVPIAGGNVDLTSSSVTGTFPSFIGTFTCNGLGCTGGGLSGSFFGPTANRAGYGYKFGSTIGDVTGVVVFGR